MAAPSAGPSTTTWTPGTLPQPDTVLPSAAGFGTHGDKHRAAVLPATTSQAAAPPHVAASPAAAPAVPPAPKAELVPLHQPTTAELPPHGTGFSAASSSSQVVGGNAAKLVEQLRKRLEVATAENEQLEEMLKKEEQRAAAEATLAQQLAEELNTLQVLVNLAGWRFEYGACFWCLTDT